MQKEPINRTLINEIKEHNGLAPYNHTQIQHPYTKYSEKKLINFKINKIQTDSLLHGWIGELKKRMMR